MNRLGQFANSEKMADEGEAAVRRLTPQDLAIRAKFLDTRATIALNWHGDVDRAEALQAQDLALRRKLPDKPLLADALNGLAIIKMQKGNAADALKLYEECLNIQRKQFGDTHQSIAITLENMGNVFFSQRKYDKAIEQLDEVLAIRTKLFGAGSFPVARTRFNMGVLANTIGKHARGLELIDGALIVFRKNLGEKHVEVGHLLGARAMSLKGLGDLDGALRDTRAALAIYDATVAPTESRRLRAVATITELLCLQGSYDAAEKTANEALSLLDPANAAHLKSIQSLRDKLARCREGRSAASQPSSSATSSPVSGN